MDNIIIMSKYTELGNSLRYMQVVITHSPFQQLPSIIQKAASVFQFLIENLAIGGVHCE